jgi:putative PIN family toxin of toxin-antitoxin system
MVRVFIDASVLFAALYSPSGFARDLLRLAIEEKVSLVISQNVLEEVERNIVRKAPQVSAYYHSLLATLNLEIISAPPQAAVDQTAAYVAEKDAHVIAAAIEANPDYLVTYDQKHLLQPPEVSRRSGLTIVTPDIVVAAILGDDDGS